ncbi:S8 family serine peptidase [Plantactinospora sp. GCM10030261]|uniref:S8 family serine peptidase n=1 Tax=Plantactinospora sp. GCM10030261 TaxID=3273420 RepID=UPI00361F0C26
MTQPPSWSRRVSTGLLAAVMAAGAMTMSGGSPATADPANDPDTLKDSPAATLGAHDADLLAKAQAKREKTVVLIVAADKGRTKDVANGLKKLGGKVGKQVDRVGYVRATVPTDKVLTAARLPGVKSVDLNEVIPLPKPEPVTGADRAASTQGVAGPGPSTPAANPFMPTHETGAVAFKKAHPEWDGRGVTIGIMDSGVDLDNPALQTTTTGERKIVDWFTATDPLVEQDFTWRAMLTEVTGPTFTYANADWTAPAGTWRVNRFSESTTQGSEPGGDVNRDGDTTDTFGILYDPVSHDIRVDANQNRDFTDDAVMRPYQEKFDVGHFGTDNPDTAVREQMPFVVEYREDVSLEPADLPGVADFVNIGIVESMHGSHVAGITAANDMLGNAEFDGAAPGAKLVSARACSWGGGCTAVALTDGMIELVTNRGVDVVNMSIGGLPALNDGHNARADLYNELINVYGVQIILSAGNSGPGINTVGDPSVASDAISVAAGISKATWLANYGSATRTPYQLFNFSSRGPREDGGFKPNITAPGSAISTTPMWQAGSPVPQAGYPLPPGYAMANGTSMSAPQTTGGAALLLSAAKATSKGVTPAALRRAMYSSAKWMDGTPAYGQGNGRLTVPGAWQLLRGGVETRDYDVVAPVCSSLSDYLTRKNAKGEYAPTPGKGSGIYNRCSAGAGGQRPGVSKDYKVKITRTSGPAGRIAHNLSWLGNDGTFRAPARVVLPLNKTVSFTVKARGDAGAHGAVLRVDDPATPAVDFEIMNTVVIGNKVTKPDYAFSTEGSVDRNLTKSYFVTVPEGTAALQVNLSGIATGSQTRFIAFNPDGVPVESTSSLACFTNFSDANQCKPQERDYQNPAPGVWEIEVEARRTSPALDNPFKLTARVQGVQVEPAVLNLPTVTAGEPAPVTWTVTNTFGPVTVTAKGGALGSSAASRPTIANGERQRFSITVPEGASRLDVSIGNPADPAADLDLFLYNEAGEEVAYDADGDSEESISLANPEPGTYEAEVHGYSVPAGSTAYDYRDVFFSPALGNVTVADKSVALGNGESTTFDGTVTAEATPVAGRQLFGEMTVVTSEGAVVGRGQVTIGSVN